MERVQINVGGRAMLVDVKTAARVQKQVEINREKSIRISRELKQERLGPVSCTHNQFAGWIGQNHIEHARPVSHLVKSSEEKFQEFLAMHGKARQALPAQF
jgi:hypothetical protein